VIGFAQKAALCIVSIAVTLLGLELGLRLFVDVTDDINYAYLPDVGLKLEPNQQGLFIRDGVHAAFHVNNAGFNSLRDYAAQRNGHPLRVAVVGDSFVEAFHVNPAESLSAVLEQELNRQGVPAEVYGFGISGFGTSQVYHLVKDYVLAYSPDAVVYLFIRNDVADSSACLARQPWTRQYDVAPNGALIALPFDHYAISPLKAVLRRSYLVRYLLYQHRLLEWLRSAPQPSLTASTSAPDGCAEKSWHIVDGLLVELDALLRQRGIPWLLVWQGDADVDYAGDVREGLRRIVDRHQLPYYDLSRDFAADFAIHQHPFRIPGDGHWNAEGHRVAGTALGPLVKALIETSPSATVRH
jgi:GDSL-like Lipase/Acylhydrolase family